jgi:hypothetical protein
LRLVDANVLIYAVNEDAPHHDRARAWLDEALAGSEAVGFSWTVLLAFLRLTTRAGLFVRPLTVPEATGVIEAWLEQPMAVVVEPTARHLSILAGLLAESGTAANLVGDAHLAALAIENGAEICSFDADFGRFHGVRWRRP